jgi:anti-sigma factor ChrR (cupin superfamily)
VILVARAWRTRAEVDRLESATLLLATAMRERQQNAQSDEIVAVVQQALEGRADKSGKHRITGALGLRKSG